jgi:hypothetical protein
MERHGDDEIRKRQRMMRDAFGEEGSEGISRHFDEAIL